MGGAVILHGSATTDSKCELLCPVEPDLLTCLQYVQEATCLEGARAVTFNQHFPCFLSQDPSILIWDFRGRKLLRTADVGWDVPMYEHSNFFGENQDDVPRYERGLR